jgi:branched-chain amino acid transport system ATP-binding protein
MNVSVVSAVDRTAAAEVAAQPILAVKNIEVIYNHVILVLRGVSLDVPQGKIVALLGGNGAGKSTTLKSISTLLGSERGAVTKGSIEFRGQRTDQLTPGELVGMGLVGYGGPVLLRAFDGRGEPDYRRLRTVHQQVAIARRA